MAEGTTAIAAAREALASARGQLLDEDARLSLSFRVAQALLETAEQLATRSERKRASTLHRLMRDERGQALTTLLTDRVFRAGSARKTASAAAHLVSSLGPPKFLSRWDRGLLGLTPRLAGLLPKPIAAGVEARVRSESRALLLSAQPGPLVEHLARRRREGVRVNVNYLGEAVLGEAEASRRREAYRALLAEPDVQSISVKLSSIFSQVDLTAPEHSLQTLKPRLREIYRAALARPAPAPLVNLDMEAYRDLFLTVRLFIELMDEAEFMPLTAGIVLQAYLPDSAGIQRTLTDWARARVARGGAPVRLRIVKGANLASEAVEASLRGWPLPIYPNKALVDANYKRMLRYGCQPEHAAAVQLGIASHNVFDLAYGLCLRAHHGVEALVALELLEGMADPLRRALQLLCDDLLVYAPAVEPKAMQSAIAYLVRRLDENTSPDNFLHHSFGMHVGDAAYREQAARFEQACRAQTQAPEAPLRSQDRRAPPRDLPVDAAFENEPDTDFSLAHHGPWLRACLAEAEAVHDELVPFQIAGERGLGTAQANGFDPSRPGLVSYRHALAGPTDIERAIACAVRAQASWSGRNDDERAAILSRVAAGLRRARGRLIASMVLDAGKRPEQADVEVSEAIDFAEYYPRTVAAFRRIPELRLRARGVTVVVPPWNFPLAIPAGGVLSALAAGNAVILKPAPETVLVAARLAEVCWEAGVPLDVLQLCLCEDEVASALITDARVENVVLTGATATAELFLRMRPDVHLLAETGGKNAIIVTALADRDLAVQSVVDSAFLHAGQKCSAASLLVLEAEVYDDPAFAEQLRDAAESLPVGSAWRPESKVTPLIRPPSGPLARALCSLDEDESWLLAPRVDPDNPQLVSPGIRWNVQPGAFTHMTELFGPVLSVLRAEDLYEAIDLVNRTGYGLTSGLQSLDEREHARWQRRIRAGNLYINRGITGAIVRRQAFGGLGKSSFGPGAKAGGPNYTLQLMHVTAAAPPAVSAPPHPAPAALLTALKARLPADMHARLAQVACDYGGAARGHFELDHDPSALVGERNVFRYVPTGTTIVRCSAPQQLEPALMACLAALTLDATFALSVSEAVATDGHRLAVDGLPWVVETGDELAQRLDPTFERVRALGQVESPVRSAANRLGLHIDDTPVCPLGRIELLKYAREQSYTHAYHRHGNLAGERLLPPLRKAPGL